MPPGASPSPNPSGAQPTATLHDLEGWLIAIAQNTRETKEAVQGRAGAGPTKPATNEESYLEKLKTTLKDAVTTGISTGLGQARSLANRGMSGTLEQAQLTYALDQLGKQFAAIMLPVTQAMTYAASEIERRMRSMGGTEQNRLMGTIIGAGLGLRFGGIPGAIGGGVLGSNLMAGASGWDAINGGGLAGAAIGARYGGPYGAVAGGIAGATAGASGGISSAYNDLRGMRDANGNQSYSRFGAGARSLIASANDAGPAGFLNWAIKQYSGADTNLFSGRSLVGLPSTPGGAAAGGGARRDVTPFQADMTNAGEQFFKMQAGVIRATAGAGFEDGGPLKPIVDWLLKIFDVLVSISQGKQYTPPPTSATGAVPTN